MGEMNNVLKSINIAVKNTALSILERELAMSKKHATFVVLITTHILNHDITNEGGAIPITLQQVYHFELVCSFPGCVYARTKQHVCSDRV